jgi:alpha-N-arabinofuranosidase
MGSAKSQVARLVVDPEFVIGDVDPRVFGSFIEHLGRAVYTGIYEPNHPVADDMGFRKDVIELTRELQVPIVRYPGGNFVSGYDWLDGIGPKEKRPRRLDLAWRSLETNQVGVDEFCEWARRANTEVNMAVNLGLAGADSARKLVEYCNHPGGTEYSDMRVANGYPTPHGIKTWCLGNEMDGEWQIGHKDAETYGRLASEAAAVMKRVDPTIELVACGSSSPAMPTFGRWEIAVLDLCYDAVDYLSVHTYHVPTGDSDVLLAQSVEMDEYIGSAVALCDAARARVGAKKRLNLAFDEWNVMYHTPEDAAMIHDDEWQIAAPLNETPYSLVDAVAVGLMLITLLRRADRVKIACMAQLVNTLAPITAPPGNPAFRQSIYYPFLHASRFGRGKVLDLRLHSPDMDSGHLGSVSQADAVAVSDAEHRAVTIFAVNRSLTDPLVLDGDVRGLESARVAEHIVLEHPDPAACNTADRPYNVVPHHSGGAVVQGGRLVAGLPKLSWNVIRLVRAEAQS